MALHQHLSSAQDLLNLAHTQAQQMLSQAQQVLARKLNRCWLVPKASDQNHLPLCLSAKPTIVLHAPLHPVPKSCIAGAK